MRQRLLLALAATGILGCAALPHATAADVSRASTLWPRASFQSLESGRGAYVARCSGCHALHLPEDQTPAEWPGVVDEMARKTTKVTDAEKELIKEYLVTVSGRFNNPPTSR